MILCVVVNQKILITIVDVEINNFYLFLNIIYILIILKN